MVTRNTIQRNLVLKAVRELACHATAEEVYDLLAKEHQNLSKGTVYRNLQRLCETGEIRKREIPDGADRFDHICSNHYHIKCVRCGKLFDVDMAFMEHLEQSVTDRHGFNFLGHELIFTGICPECQVKPD